MARPILRGHHLPGLVLPGELDLGHRRHVVRRVAKEGRRGGASGRGGAAGELYLLIISA